MTLAWMLPEHISDVLPYEAQIIESMRRMILDTLAHHGYEYVIPPLIEYTNTLNLGTQEDLAKKIFKWLDTQSQKMLGIRADMTPQIARIDAHILNTENTTRFCYCDSVLHSRTRAYDTRQPIQIGAEIYGNADLRAEIEILGLMLQIFKSIGLDQFKRRITLSVSHAGLLPALGIDLDENSPEAIQNLYQAIKHKNYAFLEHSNQAQSQASEHPHQDFLLQLLKLHDIEKVLHLLESYAITANLAALKKVADDFAGLVTHFQTIQKQLNFTQDIQFFVDVSDVESYQYHSGLEFAFYLEDYPYAIAKGGRYDAMSKAFSKNRPACGFSMNLRQLSNLYLDLLNQDISNATDVDVDASTNKNKTLNHSITQSWVDKKPIIIAPWFLGGGSEMDQLNQNINTLRQNHAVMLVDMSLEQLKALEQALNPYLQKNLQLNPPDFSDVLLKLSAENINNKHINLNISHLQAFKVTGFLGLGGLYTFNTNQ